MVIRDSLHLGEDYDDAADNQNAGDVGLDFGFLGAGSNSLAAFGLTKGGPKLQKVLISTASKLKTIKHIDLTINLRSTRSKAELKKPLKNSFDLLPRFSSPAALQFATCKVSSVLKPILSAGHFLYVKLIRPENEKERAAYDCAWGIGR